MRSTSSSSSSDSTDGNYKRGKRRARKSRRTFTPPLRKSPDRVSRLEALVEKLVTHQVEPKTDSRRVFAKPECIPKFTPGNPCLSSTKWIEKIEQLATINKWDEPTLIFLMQSRLSGLARSWYDNLPSYQFTWTEWKELIIRSFPEHRDFATTLRNLITRNKIRDESWERYYFDKMELLNACDIVGSRAVSCIIDGIRDPSIQAGAKAGRYERPDLLYAEYLSVLKPENDTRIGTRDKYLHKNIHKRPFNERLGSETHETKKNRQLDFKKNKRCYNCKEVGHFSDKCLQPKKECGICKRLGHLAKDCRRSVQNQTVLNSSCTYNENYFFDCWVNEKPLQAYVDSGCGAVLIKEDAAISLKLLLFACSQSVVGYGGFVSNVLGKAKVWLKVDQAEAEVEALIVPNAAQETPVLVGQPFLNQAHIMMIVAGDTVRVLHREDDICAGINMQPRKIPLWAKESVVIGPRRTALVAVTSREQYLGDVYVPSSIRSLPGREHILGECITDAQDGYVAITNLSAQDIEVSDRYILARCVACFEDRHPCLSIPSLSVTTQMTYDFTADDLICNTNFSMVQVQELVSVINEYRECFSQTTDQLGKSNILKMSIHLNDDRPVVYRPYRLSHNERQTVRNIVSDLLENNIIRESTSPYSSPILLVKKKNGEQRMCIDYRALNAKTVKDRFPLPLVDDFLEKLKGCQYFTSLDLASGYYQIEMEDSSVAKTAFITPDGHYEFLRVPFGLSNAPAVFQRTINKVLGNLRYGKALAYMDDILLPAVSFEDGIKNLKLVLQSLKEAHLTLRLSKCQFFMTKVDYLGHEISSEGVQPGKRKIEAVEKFPVPTDVHSVRQFLGLTSYFRKYIKNYATIAKPLTILTKKDVSFTWGDEQREAFETLKDKLTSRPVLAIYDHQLETEVHTDASKWGIGGILMQKQKDQTLRPVLYYSRQTTKEEQRYHSYELETMAVVYTLKTFRIYLIGIQFKVVTDCNAIRTTLTKRDLVPRIGRWWLNIQEYTFDVEYRPGHRMTHADALSRNPIDPQMVEVTVINIHEEDWVLSAQKSDERCRFLLETIQKNPTDKEEHEIHKNFRLVNQRLYRITEKGDKWVVPRAARRQITFQMHDCNGHLAVDKTVSAISNVYWFAGMRRYVKKYISCCLQCLYNKESGGKKPGFMHPIEKFAIPFDTLHIDHLGPFVKSKRKNTHLVVIVDAFTKFVFIKAVTNTKVRPIIMFLDNVFENFGVPRRIVSDRGSCFTSKQFAEYCRKLNIKHVLNATATPRANGQVERYNRTILSSLASSTDDERKWDEAIAPVRWGLNSTMNSSTGKSPYELLFGYAPRRMGDAVLANEVALKPNVERNMSVLRANAKARIDTLQGKRKALFDARRRAGYKFKEGQQVLVRTTVASHEGQSKKLLPKYSGPYMITKVLDHDRYVVKDLEGSSRSQRSFKGVVSLDKLKPFHIDVCSDSEGEFLAINDKNLDKRNVEKLD